MFKLTLSAEQFAELLRADGEVEEGEEGGLRLEFESSGKGNLHLSPTSVLPLASPRSGLPSSNKPEEIYQHQQQPGVGRMPLTGLMRIPVGTPTFEVHRPPTPPPVVPVAAPAPAAAPVPPRVSLPEPAQTRSTAMAPPLSDQRQKERLAGQRLKEKRMEEERRKKEKQMVVLTDAPVIPVAKRGKVKAKTGAAKNVVDRSRSKALPPKPATLPTAPPPIRRALPGSATGKQLASEHNNQYLHASTASTPTITLNNPTLPAVDTSAQFASTLPPPTTQAPIPSPQPTTYKRSSSNKRGSQKSTPPSNTSDETSTADNTAKLSATTAITSLSEGSESELSRSKVHPDPVDRGPPKSILSASQPSSSDPIRKSVGTAKADVSKTHKHPPASQESFLPPPPAPIVKSIRESSSLPPAPMTVSATSLPVAPLAAKKKVVKKGPNGRPIQAKRVIKSSATVHSDDDDEDDDIEREEQTRRESDVNDRRAPSIQSSTMTKKRRPLDESTTRNDEPSNRPAKLARTDSGSGSTGQAGRRTDSPSNRLQAGSEWDDPRQKRASAQPTARNSSVMVRKVTDNSIERAPSPANKSLTQTNVPTTKKKRPLEDGAASGPAVNGSQAAKEPEVRRSHPMGVILPTIRKIQAATEDGRGSGQSDNDSKDHHGPMKKKKKKRTVDYTSSEDEASAPTPQAGLNSTQTNNHHLGVKRDPSPRPSIVSEVSSQSNPSQAPDDTLIKKTKPNGGPILPSFKRQSQPNPSMNRPIEDKTNPNSNRTSLSSSESEQEEIDIRNSNGYAKARLRYYWLTCHYGYLIDKLNQIRSKKITGIGLEEIKEMIDEVKCVEEEISIRKDALERYGEGLKNGKLAGK
ncbi:hypothetical protein DFH28DRAFT_923944 [Melampsora americana]|nr:hypothetical protein DFH28DRAFT_923944 [Melampsora americana]